MTRLTIKPLPRSPRGSLKYAGTIAGLLASMACTDPEAPPALASIGFALTPPDSALTDKICRQSTTALSIPVGDSEVARLSSFTDSTTAAGLPRVKDGSDKAKIRCSVVEENAGVYSISANITKDDLHTFTVNGTAPGTAKLSFFHKEALNVYGTNGANVCTLQVDEMYEDAGSVRVSFECGLVNNPSIDNEACGAKGAFILERCDH